jgi:hypothetical protein
MMAETQVAPGSNGSSTAAQHLPDAPWREPYADWKLHTLAASRYDRDMLQYGAGMAAIFGIGAGTGGMFALAKAVKPQEQLLSNETLERAFAVGALFAALLFFGLTWAYGHRVWEQRQADKAYRQLTTVTDPDLLTKLQ